MAVSGAAFSTGMRDMWFERQKAQRGAPSGVCRQRLDQYPVWLGQVMDRACFLRSHGDVPPADIIFATSDPTNGEGAGSFRTDGQGDG